MLSPASPDEAAAVVAAVERFLADTSPAPAQRGRVRPWQRAALLEGVSAKAAFASPWGEAMAWGKHHAHRP
jgi:hypothetical protein